MKLHEFPSEFRDLISIVAKDKHLPESAIERDYYIVLLLKNLADSEYIEKCVFKGGTSLSKCYPGSIERFSEDIDLTFLGMDENDKTCDKAIKRIEKIMTVGAFTDKINEERSNRSNLIFYRIEPCSFSKQGSFFLIKFLSCQNRCYNTVGNNTPVTL